MASRNIQVNLQFNANTQNAKIQMQNLQNQLSNLINTSGSGTLGITPQIQEATRSAMDLKIALQNATNMDTGKLNLNKFQSELNRSGKSIQQYAQQMKMLGPAGVKAFTEVAHAVAQADTRLFSLQGGMKKLANTFMNTMRWQITSQAIMAVTSAISETVDYAKELDTSLNNIRIVTGKSADQMARFAKEANKAAKELSTTTTKYTDASLIYYQQGLNDRAVKERTDVTVKLANVVGEQAETVSEWMTAIWNNFDDGSESLEHYADVLATLGAATASSADEIAGGLEKFAAVADTIGLSYEYAASALATITAETRQSEDVVGTALKTILSRMEQLKLGDVLDDGTTLGQYSLALQTVGVNIKDANGELKDMDIILQQTGQRWETLARDEQIALAQSVAGIRQYTQFMALMDNWDVMEKNLELTEQANGALNEQHDIYEEGTKAAEERMKVATESIKATLFGGEELKGLYDFGAGALEVIAELLEAFGGLPTILLAVAAALTKVYQPQVASFLSQAVLAAKDLGKTLLHPIKAIKGENTSTSQQFRMDTIESARKAMAETEPSDGGSVSNKLLLAEADARKAIIQNENQINASTKQRLEWQLELLKQKKEEVLVLEDIKQKSQEAYSQSVQQASNQGIGAKDINALTMAGNNAGKLSGQTALLGAKLSQASEANVNALNTNDKAQLATGLEGNLTAMEQAASSLNIELNKIGGNSFETIKQAIETLKNDGIVDIEELIRKFKELQNALNGTNGQVGAIGEALNKPKEAIGSGLLSEEVDKLNGVSGRTTNAEILSSALDQVDETKFGDTKKMTGMTKDPKEAKTAKQYLKQYKDKAKALAQEQKDLEEQQKGLDKSSKKYKTLEKRLQKNKTDTKELGKEITKFKKNLNGATDASDNYTKAMDDLSDSAKKTAENTEIVNEGSEEVVEGFEQVGDSAKKGGQGFTHWSDNLTSDISNMATYAMGLSMLSSAFEQMGSSIAKGEGGWTNWISNISSLLMGIMMIMPALSSMNKLILQSANASKAKTLAEYAEIAATKIKSLFHKKTMAEEKEEQKEKQKTSLWKILSAWAEVAEDAGEGPTGWVKAIASAAMIAPIALAIGAAAFSFSSGNKQAKKEAKEEEVSKGIETIEAVNENQELAGSVTDLTEEYNALRNAGESTADILEDMREKIPELIDSYKELAKTIGMPIDTSALEDAYQNFLATGDTTAYEAAQKEIDDKIADKQKSTAGTTLEKATDLMIGAGREGRGWLDGDTYRIDLGEPGSEADTILKDAFGDNWDGDNVKIDATDPGEVLQYYENAIKARDKLKEAGLENTAAYERLNEDIKQMSGYVEDAYTAQEAQFNIIKEELLAAEKESLDKIKLSDGTTGDQIKDLKEYETYRQQLIDSLVKEHNMTEAQAISYLKATNALGQYEDAITTFGTATEKTARANTITQRFGEQGLEKAKEFYEGLSKEDRTLFLSIDFSTIESLNNLDQVMQELRDKAAEAKILQEVTKLDVDEAVFETYTEGLAEINTGLEKNSVLTKQIALNNLKISKGLETLTKSWDDNFEIMSRANKASLEYAEAVGEIKKALEEMFGVQPSTEYIEEYKNELNEMVNGNLESLETLQDALAEDYILNMDFKQAINNDWTGTIANAQEQLRGLLDDIDTSIEVGKETTLSSDYLNSVQDMLDAGVIAEEQLEDLFRAKGYELNITGWKKMPGPKTTMVRSVYDGETGATKYTERIEQSEELTVPIINGKTDGLEVSGTPSTATVTKSTDKRVIDTSGAEERNKKKEDRINSLDKEKDRYHEINEIISDTERELDKLGKAKDRAYGASKLALLDREIEKQKELIENNKELLRQAEDNVEIDKKNLIKNTSSAYTLEFDEYGRIANYEDIENAYIEKLKANAGNTTKYEELEKDFENFKDAASQYEKTLNKVEEQSEKVNDEIDALYEKSLEEIEYKVEVRVEMADDDQAYIDFMMQKLEDDAFAAADKIGLLGKEAENTLEKIAANQQGIADIEDAVANGDITPAQGVEKLRKFRDEIIDLNADLQKLRQTVQDNLTEAYEAWNEKIEKGISSLEFYGSVLSGYKNIIDIVGKDMLGLSDEAMEKLNKAIVSNANDTIRATKAQLDANNATLAKLKEARKKAEDKKDEEAVKAWDKQIEMATKKSQELTTTLQDALATGLQAAADAFGDQVNQIADDFSKAVSGIYDSISDMRENWDRMGEVADRYLKTYEQAYQINKLNRQIEQNINSTDNIKTQRELKSLQSEMFDMTKDGQQMSKYDLEYLQKKYNLLLAEQALKDAQNAKSSARLTRDSSGNFGYVYTADQKNIDSAQQKYEDEAYAYQQYVDNMDQELTEMYISAQERMEERIREASEKYGEGTEEFKTAQKQIIEEYKQDIEYITNEYDKITERNLDINQRFSLGVADTYEETFLGSILRNYENFAVLYDSTTQIAEGACIRLNQAVVGLRDTFKAQFDLAGEDFGGFADIANKKFGDIAQDSSDTADAVETMASKMDTELNGEGGAIDAVSTFYTEYSKKMEGVRTETGNTIKKVQELITEYQNLIDKAAEADGTKPPEKTKGEDPDDAGNEDDQPPKPKYALNSAIGVFWTEQGLIQPNAQITNQKYDTKNKQWLYQLNNQERWIPEQYLKLPSPSLNAPSQEAPKEQFVTSSTAPERKYLYGSSLTETLAQSKQNSGYEFYEGYVKVDGVWYKTKDLESETKTIKKQGTTVKTGVKYYLKKGQQGYIKQYDTGGYTGSWGPEGRMAMLHQKEIVLNAHDTENFLAAVEIVRSIATQLENNALRTSQGLGSLVTAAAVNNNREVLEQNVTIHAEFPNATDHNEIELAFNDLINQASQYVNRR